MRSSILAALAALTACGRIVDPGHDAGDTLDDGAIDGGPVCNTSSSVSPQATCNFRWGNGNEQEPNAVATDSLGDTLVVGGFGGTLTLGPNTITGPDTEPQPLDGPLDQAFAVLFNATCEPQWALSFDSSFPATRAVALPGNRFALMTSVLEKDFYADNVIVLDRTGQVVWSKHYSGTPPNESTGYATFSMAASDRAGNLVLVGTLLGTADFGGGEVSSGAQPGGQLGIVLKLDPQGHFIFNSTFHADAEGPPNSDGEYASAIAVDTNQIWLVGALGAPSKLDFDGGGFDIGVDAAANDYLGYVARLSLTDGHYLGGSSYERTTITGVVSDACTGRTSVVGTVQPGVDLGLGPLATEPSSFVLQLDGEGKPIWNQAFALAWTSSIAADGVGNVVIADSKTSTLDAGGYATDLLLSAYGLDGQIRFARSRTSPSAGFFGVTVGGDGSIRVIGTVDSYSTLDFGAGALSQTLDAGNASTDGFFLKLQ